MLSKSVILASILLAATGASAQERPAEPEPTVLEDIIVRASPSEARALRFIDRVAGPPSGRRLARWEKDMCARVAGLDQRYGQFVVDRVTAVAVSVGLRPGVPGCEPDILIIFTADPDAAAARLIEEDLNTFRPTRYGATDRGAEALERFKTSDAPVRWWHVSAPVSTLSGEVAIGLNGDGPPTMTAPNSSRIKANTREALLRAVLIVDTTRIGDISFGALGEYLGMIAMAQIDPDLDVKAYDSVLNLFSSPSQRITEWDQDYLQALYRAPADQFRFVQQASDIAEAMKARAERRQERTGVASTAH